MSDKHFHVGLCIHPDAIKPKPDLEGLILNGGDVGRENDMTPEEVVELFTTSTEVIFVLANAFISGHKPLIELAMRILQRIKEESDKGHIADVAPEDVVSMDGASGILWSRFEQWLEHRVTKDSNVLLSDKNNESKQPEETEDTGYIGNVEINIDDFEDLMRRLGIE